MSQIRFLVFSDLHYKKKMYPVKVSDLEAIIFRAEREQVELIVHEGDFCNDYCRSPEIFRPVEECKLPVFGVYGNHEMEGRGNTMSLVTPRLTNRAKQVRWATPDGMVGDGTVGYYYYDHGDFRFIFLDSNYSLMPDGVTYEHNREAGWGAPEGNTRGASLGDRQLVWLESVLTEAARTKKHCIVNAHRSFAGGDWPTSPDHEAVRALYAKVNALRRRTVLMSINGDYHTNRAKVVEGVFYLDVNVAINGWWQPERFYPYGQRGSEESLGYTFEFTDYDQEGRPTTTRRMPLAELSMGEQTLFFETPLSAVVTVNTDGDIRVEGSQTKWSYGKTSPHFFPGIASEISDFSCQL